MPILHTFRWSNLSDADLCFGILAILFLQSGIDKIVDSPLENFEWLKGHFGNEREEKVRTSTAAPA